MCHVCTNKDVKPGKMVTMHLASDVGFLKYSYSQSNHTRRTNKLQTMYARLVIVVSQ